MQTFGKVYYKACFVAVLSVRPLMLCSSAQCSHACVVVLALVPGNNIFWVWELLPFPDFLGRFASWQAASGISECFVAASPLLEFLLARVGNRRISECSVAASGIAVSSSLAASGLSECSVAASGIAVLTDPRIADDVALPDEPEGLQHSSSHSALILSSSIFVNHFLETIIDTA